MIAFPQMISSCLNMPDWSSLSTRRRRDWVGTKPFCLIIVQPATVAGRHSEFNGTLKPCIDPRSLLSEATEKALTPYVQGIALVDQLAQRSLKVWDSTRRLILIHRMVARARYD
jgi:hypothetical protein